MTLIDHMPLKFALLFDHLLAKTRINFALLSLTRLLKILLLSICELKQLLRLFRKEESPTVLKLSAHFGCSLISVLIANSPCFPLIKEDIKLSAHFQ